MILPGVDHYRVTDAMSEGMRIVLSYLGEPYSPAYVQGISGAAFRMAGICPCAPTCSGILEPVELARLFGYQAEWWPYQGTGIEGEKSPDEILKRVKSEIRGGKPVLLWHAFTSAEWDVVCGFDEEQKVFYGRGSYIGLAGEDYACAEDHRSLNCLELCPALGAVFVGDKVSVYDTREAEIAALKDAVMHGRSNKLETREDGKWVFLEGVQCYQRWAMEFSHDPNRRRTPGDSYCLGIYRSTHRAAGFFLHELAAKYRKAAVFLRQAQQAFEREADYLDRCEPILGWKAPEGPDLDRNERADILLEQAGEAYADGIEAIADALGRM